MHTTKVVFFDDSNELVSFALLKGNARKSEPIRCGAENQNPVNILVNNHNILKIQRLVRAK